jgi:decaprenylphospho-beta-D-erythro-pentofuranosid-2-ulose 2-reductase
MSTVLILGASSDMAVAIANKFAANGHDIQLAGRNSRRIEPLRSDIAIRHNVNCTVHEFDALRFNSHPTFFSQLPGTPDITICVFGYLGDNSTGATDWDESEKIINSNYTGAVSILNIISNHYSKQKKGTIAGISSVAGLRGRQSNYVYGSAKAGFTAYLSGLRNRFYRDNVHVVTILPGFVYTKMTENISLPKLLTAHPEEVGNAVFKAIHKKKNVVYVKWFWRWIMLIITSLPESVFKKLRL